MAKFSSYPNKSKPADSDTLLINDSSASANKQILLSGLFAWLKDKFTNTPISGLETTNQTIVGAINELKEDLDNIEGGGGSGDGLTSEVKDALLAIFQHVAYADSSGQTYYDALEEALYPTVTTRTVSYSLSHVTSSNNASTVTSGASYTATLTASSGYTINTVTVTMGGADVTSTVYSSGTITIPSVTGNIVITATAVASVSSISAVYTQSGTVYTNTNLDSLKSDLVVTATYTGGTTSTIPGTDYTLSGTLAEGTSTITVTYGGQTTTFTVTVSHAAEYTRQVAEVGTFIKSGVYANGYDGTPASIAEDVYSISDVRAGDVIQLATNWNSTNVVGKESRWISTPSKVAPDITAGTFTNVGTSYGLYPVTINQDYETLYIGIINTSSGGYKQYCTWTRESGF